MKRQSEYIKNHRLSYQIAGIMLIIATVGFTLMYFYQKNVMQRQSRKVLQRKKASRYPAR